jgi:hypothetical protein
MSNQGAATFSVEGRVLDRLRKLDMNTSQLVRIAQAFDFPVSTALVSLVLSGKREFTRWTGEKLLELTEELVALKEFYDKQGIPLAWGVSDVGAECVATLLVKRRADACDDAAGNDEVKGLICESD